MLKPNFGFLYITVANTVASHAVRSQRLPGIVLGSCSLKLSNAATQVVAGWVSDSPGQGAVNICEIKYLSFYE